MKESMFQAQLIKRLYERFPGCVIFKNDPRYFQGFPDITILYKNKWAILEVKESATASHQPNQDIWVDRLNAMSYSRFVYPENVEEVLNELEQSFEISG